MPRIVDMEVKRNLCKPVIWSFLVLLTSSIHMIVSIHFRYPDRCVWAKVMSKTHQNHPMASHLWNLALRRAEATQVQPGKLAVASTVRNCKMRFITMSVEICRYCILHRYSISIWYMCQLCVYNLCISLYVSVYLHILVYMTGISVRAVYKYVSIRICKGQTKTGGNNVGSCTDLLPASPTYE